MANNKKYLDLDGLTRFKQKCDEKYLTSHQDISGKANTGSSNTFSGTQTIVGGDDTSLKLKATHSTDSNIEFDNSGGTRLGNIGCKGTRPYFWAGSGGTTNYIALASDIPTVPTNVSAFTNDSGYLTSSTGVTTVNGYSGAISGMATQNWVNTQIANKTNTSVLPNDNGNIKTKFRMAVASYTGGSSTYWYYPIAKLPVDNAGNSASCILSGRIGGWVSSNMSSITSLIWNRDGTGIALLDIAGTASAMSTIWNLCDIVVYTNDDATDTIYLKCANYFTFDIDIELYQNSATILYDGTKLTTTPTGTLSAQASTSTKRLELVNGKLLVNGTQVSTFSGSYNDLTNKPTIPTVNNKTITIVQGGTTKGTFNLNQSYNSTIYLASGGGKEPEYDEDSVSIDAYSYDPEEEGDAYIYADELSNRFSYVNVLHANLWNRNMNIDMNGVSNVDLYFSIMPADICFYLITGFPTIVYSKDSEGHFCSQYFSAEDEIPLTSTEIDKNHTLSVRENIVFTDFGVWEQ